MHDPQTLKIVLGAIVAILSLYLTYRLGVRKQAPIEKAAETAEDQSAVEGWAKLAKEYREEFSRLGREVADLRSEVNGLRNKVGELERERDQHRFWRLVGVDYIKALLAVLAEHGLPAPAQPPGLNLDR